MQMCQGKGNLQYGFAAHKFEAEGHLELLFDLHFLAVSLIERRYHKVISQSHQHIF